LLLCCAVVQLMERLQDPMQVLNQGVSHSVGIAATAGQLMLLLQDTPSQAFEVTTYNLQYIYTAEVLAYHRRKFGIEDSSRLQALLAELACQDDAIHTFADAMRVHQEVHGENDSSSDDDEEGSCSSAGVVGCGPWPVGSVGGRGHCDCHVHAVRRSCAHKHTTS
jgi:hypothetical protein